MPIDNRGRLPGLREVSLPIKEPFSSPHEAGQSKSLDVSSSQPPPAQDIVVRRPREHNQRKDPRHIVNPDGEDTRQLRVYSYRDRRYTEINVTVVTDMDQCWISEDVVKRLELKRKVKSKDETKWGCLGLQTFEFSGTVTLQWICNNNSKPTICRVVPRKDFEIYLPSSLLPPLPRQEMEATLLNPLSVSSLSDLNVTLPVAITSPTNFTGQFDGEEVDDYLETSEEAKWADEWMCEMKKVHNRKPQGYVRDTNQPPIKIAVLDTGIDLEHNSVRAAKKQNRFKTMKSFVKGDHNIGDSHGHGTHVATLLLKVAPDSQLYIAKVASGGKIPLDHNIADAIEWAIECEVDIITMSFGIDKDHISIQTQIQKAYSKNILMFAAASNKGCNHPIPFPARKGEVLCIYATDGKGYAYKGNPTLGTTDCHFATLGVAVKSAWPEHLLENHPSDRSGERRTTGTSFATPIVAGIAAYILDFARVQKLDAESYRMLRTRDGMKKIFADHLVNKNGGLDYIHPWKLFADYRPQDTDVLLLIKDSLAEWVGKPSGAELCD